jgi:hypothetical protein
LDSRGINPTVLRYKLTCVSSQLERSVLSVVFLSTVMNVPTV